jgi:uncharacterized protein (TIGR02246 family)
MKRTAAATTLVIVLATAFGLGTAPSAQVAKTGKTSMSQDEAEIHKTLTDMREAWNRHDAKAWASLCTEDGDVVNVVGWWWKGRPQIEKKVGDAHAFIFRESTLTHDEVHIRFLTSQIAVVHVLWSMVGQKKLDGTPGQPRKGIETDVLQKQAGKWLIAAFQNTDSVPEVPFPTGPAKK